MTEQWQELKETITELRDNDGTGTQQEVCKFLTNYMDVLEKQMQKPCEDAISRKDILNAVFEDDYMKNHMNGDTWERLEELIGELPPVQPKQRIGHWIAEGDFECHCSECHLWCYKRNRSRYCRCCGAKME